MSPAERIHICGLLRAARRMMMAAQDAETPSVVADYLDVAMDFTRMAYDIIDLHGTALLGSRLDDPPDQE